ncbi:MAG TPA: neuraminidase-like domain-containing protein, partial [Ktedonobacteraceae bacterium]|nr:neuraminidase-like domain-containing protein [Ktedonobacteraceae bacterium]
VFTLNADGSELKTVSAKIVDYVPVLLATLRITAADWASLWSTLKAANLPDNTSAANVLDDTSLINLANLSTLYSYSVLAKALKLSIKDLLSLFVLTTKDPFKVISLASIIEFVSKVRKVQQSGFSVAQLNYLYRHLYEPNRGIAPLQNNVELLIKGLQDGLKKIASDTVVVPDPTGDLLRRKLSIIIPDSKLVDTAMKVIDGSIGSQADSAAFGIQVDPATFIDTNFGSFLNTTEAKTKLLAGSTLSKKEERFAYVLAPLMAYLHVSLSHSFVKQSFSDALKLDTTMIDVLLETILKSPADKTKTALADFLALVGDGLSATYFGNQDFTGITASRIDPTVDFSWGKEAPDPVISPGTFSARWIGKVLAQYDEVYTFYIGTSESVRLWVNNTLLLDVQNPSSPEQSGTIPLQAGQLYDIKMEYSHSQSTASIQLLWSSSSTPKAIIPQGQLYSTASFSFDQPLQSYYLLYKVAMLIDTFKMTVKEVTYISQNGSDFSNFDFNELPLDPSGFSSTLLDHWELLADFFILRNSLPQGEVGLTDVLQAGTLDDLKSKLYAATNWDPAQFDDLSDTTNGFNLTTLDDFRKVQVLSRLQACLTLSKHLGVSIKHLFDWATTSPDAPQAQEIKDTVKAKYDDQEWLTVAKSINDGLRESQRTALVAYLLQNQDMKPALQDSNLQQSNVNDSSQLYKYFLIDIDMSACMMTSRIVQAISSVQLFVQRCLMNLEQEVSPDAINADQWKWMKRYRVWEANRKVFLYPENWIEPELRDDKSPFFKELETELLQNEVTMDTVEQVFLNYLEKLDQVARLEICGMYWEEEVNQEEVLSDNMNWRGLSNQEASDEINIL